MNLGDRIKRYESVTRNYAMRRTPLIIRVDGRAFHTFTKGYERPFDKSLMSAMVEAAKDTARGMQGFKAAYIQSDEATFLLTDYDTLETEGWFDYNLSKIISISAAQMSVSLIKHLRPDTFPVFDSRAFNVPDDDVVNTFLWRAKDWQRNSLQMYAQAFFSHSQLQGKNQAAMHEMLHKEGYNWATDLTPQERNGTFFLRRGDDGEEIRYDVLPTYAAISAIIDPLINRG